AEGADRIKCPRHCVVLACPELHAYQAVPVGGGYLPSTATLRSAFQYDRETMRRRSTRSPYLRATLMIFSSNPCSRVVGLSPSFFSPSLTTTRSFRSASRRGLGIAPIFALAIREMSCASSETRWVSVIWLKILTRSLAEGAFSTESRMHSTES